MSGPRISTGPDSRQDYETPAAFIAAVEKRFGPIVFDLAASRANFKHSRFFSEADSAFNHDWRLECGLGLLWLNPPFADIALWAKKCGEGGSIAFLTPASVGSNWARDYVFGKADVYLLTGRLCFDGKSPFPKDCMLSHFHPDALGLVALWDWRRDELTQVWWPDKRVASVAAAKAIRLFG